MNIHFVCRHEIVNEFLDIFRAFEPHIVLDEDSDNKVWLEYKVEEDLLMSKVSSSMWECDVIKNVLPEDGLLRKRQLKRYTKRQLYFYLSKNIGQRLPYGSLTGIRPTKLYYDLKEEGQEPKEVFEYFGVCSSKIGIVEQIINTQKGIYATEKDKYNYFVNIPFCPTRCSYCSFISHIIDKVKNKLEDYVECIIKDMNAVRLDEERRAIYVGGGTPTAIHYSLLDKILKNIDANGEEFTVEAGRPDTITLDNIAVMKDNGVNRISINPQTFKEKTLKLIGREHSVSEVYVTYERAKAADFDVNMDLITMLPEESYEDFCNSVNSVIELYPENITIHSLSIKRGSHLKEQGYAEKDCKLAAKMSDYAYKSLKQAGYLPYYMYRQKNTAGRLENIGYTLPNKACVYNIDIMEETHSVYASGAGAISKKISKDNRIDRLAQPKDVYNYIERIEELIQKKKDFFG